MIPHPKYLFYVILLLFKTPLFAQLQKGVISIKQNPIYASINDSDTARLLSPSLMYAINDRWLVGINPRIGKDNFAENKSKDLALSSWMQFVITPTLKRKIYLKEGFSINRNDFVSENIKYITNSSALNLGLGMYRFINPHIAFNHLISYQYSFSARRKNDKPSGNTISKQWEYTLSLQNFAQFPLKDTILDEPFEAGRCIADLNINFKSEKEFGNSFYYNANYGRFVADNLLFGLGINGSKQILGFEPYIRYYVPIKKRAAIFANANAWLFYRFSDKEAFASSNIGIGYTYLLNNNIGIEATLNYEKDYIEKLNSSPYYFGLHSGLKYYF
jgi:hypothetical protein